MTECTKEERTVMIGYILGLLAREANQKGDVEVSTNNIEKLLGLFGLDPKITTEDEMVIEFAESMTFKVNLENNAPRDFRRWNLMRNRNVYKLQ